MSEGTPTRLRQLQKRAEELLIEGHRDRQVVAILERIADEAEESSEPALFAHRQLAELRLEDSPWRAALHLRRLTSAGVDDDGVFALLGLCHALMGNFRTAVTSYRRALHMSGSNPWYHHNLGHLLDVGLGQPQRALFHLREAYKLEAQEDEITASLAHCLARLGYLEEAHELAEKAVAASPDNPEHVALLEWVDAGAPSSEGGTPRRAQVRAGGASTIPPEAPPLEADGSAQDGDPSLAEQVGVSLREAGLAEGELRAAQLLLHDYEAASELSAVRHEVLAATIEYAVCKLRGVSTTQASVAARHGVSKSALSSRYRHLREALELATDASRYCDA